MHVCFFTHYTEMAGGSNFSLVELMRKLQAQGVEITLITPNMGEINGEANKLGIRNKSFSFFPFRDGYYMWTTPDDTGIHWLKNRVKMQINKLTVPKITEYLSSLNVDIIHTNCSVTCVGAEVAKRLSIPHIWHIREYNVEDFNWKFIYGRRRSIQEIEDKSKELIFISKDLESKYRVAYPQLKEHPVIYNGIDVKRFYYNQNPEKFKSQDICIAMSGSVSAHKNQGELIKAIGLLPEQYKKHVSCIFIGGEDPDYRRELDRNIQSFSLKNQITFLGHRSDVNELLRGAHIAVTASRCEAFGRVTVEYMMAGLAVIVSNTGANPEIVKDGETGLVYQYGKPEDLRDKIKWYMDHRDSLQNIAMHGQADACERFTSDMNAANIYNLYKKVLGRE
jgi:glycosyltransferase involved in cell wall biosynthesis